MYSGHWKSSVYESLFFTSRVLKTWSESNLQWSLEIISGQWNRRVTQDLPWMMIRPYSESGHCARHILFEQRSVSQRLTVWKLHSNFTLTLHTRIHSATMWAWPPSQIMGSSAMYSPICFLKNSQHFLCQEGYCHRDCLNTSLLLTASHQVWFPSW